MGSSSSAVRRCPSRGVRRKGMKFRAYRVFLRKDRETGGIGEPLSARAGNIPASNRPPRLQLEVLVDRIDREPFRRGQYREYPMFAQFLDDTFLLERELLGDCLDIDILGRIGRF